MTRHRQQGYTESTEGGSDELALTYGGQTTTKAATVLGTQVRQTVDLGGHALPLRAELTWSHHIGSSNKAATANFTSAAD